MKGASIVAIIGLLVVSYFSLFHKIGKEPIRIWDESLFALRATYMAENNAYMPNFNKLHPALPDHRNTKMPLLTMVQAASFKVFGLGERSLRIPLSIILVACFGYFIFFAKNTLGNIWIGLFTALGLLTAQGFLGDHMARFGDHDVVFGMFLFLSVCFYYRYIQNNQRKDIYLFGVFMLLSLLTKSILAFQFVPGIILYLAIKKRLQEQIKNPSTYIVAGAVLLVFIGMLGYLESCFPGFLERTWSYELGGRYSKTIEGHQGGFFYFLQLWATESFLPWFVFAPVGLYALLDKKGDERILDFIRLMCCIMLSAYLIFSFSQTKTFWYATPMYYPLAFISAFGVWHIMLATRNVTAPWKYISNGLLLLCFLMSLSNVIDKNINASNVGKDEQYKFFLKKLEKDSPTLKTFSIADNNFGTSAYFYTHQYNKHKNYDIEFRKGSKFEIGEIIMVCLNNTMDPIYTKYETKQLNQFKMCKLLEIVGRKNTDN